MKKIKLLLPILILLFFSELLAQDCLPNGIKFRTQEQVDSFPINYPTCTQISGHVFVQEKLPHNIINLESLKQITSIEGNLVVNSNQKGEYYHIRF